MATIEPTGTPGPNDVAGSDQQAFDAAVDNARVTEIVGEAVGSLAASHLLGYAGDMLKDEG
ncbi:hypothetical protein [Halomonas heilongjiangensis]|uniref:Uncharacterized protein n=1 Tax=Halomonas heilongjiangensis TaxID=1387883 RepID=A0A2N7TPL3_9GAMM|nr:hypothetical protein [Halomonas heilongjiangensis]PMR70130.1 hypothetical protein C1H66_08570 [Halomonas heilongjiangensis]PXX94494.1 hypothetical protein CR158_00875 [Halomonas heilongjiangensis]